MIFNDPIVAALGPPAWTPESLVQPGDSWLLTDLDGSGGVTLHTQPVIANADFSSDEPPGVAWARGIGWTVSGGVGVCDGSTSTSLIQTVSVQDNRFLAKYDVPSVVAGGVYFRLGTTTYGPQRVASGTYTEERTAPSSGVLGFFSPVGGFQGTVDNVTTKNLSINQLTCKGNLGNLAQATAANMQWSSDADAPTSVRLNTKRVIYSDGTADRSVSSGAASTHPYHKAAGFTYTEVIRPDAAAAGTDTLVDTCNATGTNVGITVEYDATNTQIIVRVANADGGGVFVVAQASGAGTVPKAAWTRVAVSWSEAAGVIIRTDEDAPVTAASVGAASAADATATLQYGGTSGAANFFHGGRAGLLIKTGAVDSASLGRWLAWAKAYYAL